jgi:mannose-6-phosphate isomerase-like protein (cupin superfamily)
MRLDRIAGSEGSHWTSLPMWENRRSMTYGYLTSEFSIEPHQRNGDSASIRVTIDRSTGCEQLEQRVIRFAPGRSKPRTHEGVQELLYIVSGDGTLHLDGRSFELEPDLGAYVVAGETYEVENPGPAELVVVSVIAPYGNEAAVLERRTVRFADQPALPAKPDREFRFLVDRELGCRDVTQFVGIIPPGRAPLHSHTYDEVIYVIEGEGKLHMEGDDRPLARGSCIHLPPLVEHCLENTGANKMRVLGVFYPQGDPASRASEETV